MVTIQLLSVLSILHLVFSDPNLCNEDPAETKYRCTKSTTQKPSIEVTYDWMCCAQAKEVSDGCHISTLTPNVEQRSRELFLSMEDSKVFSKKGNRLWTISECESQKLCPFKYKYEPGDMFMTEEKCVARKHGREKTVDDILNPSKCINPLFKIKVKGEERTVSVNEMSVNAHGLILIRNKKAKTWAPDTKSYRGKSLKAITDKKTGKKEIGLKLKHTGTVPLTHICVRNGKIYLAWDREANWMGSEYLGEDLHLSGDIVDIARMDSSNVIPILNTRGYYRKYNDRIVIQIALIIFTAIVFFICCFFINLGTAIGCFLLGKKEIMEVYKNDNGDNV